ncbi:MAG: HEAT repeat domain-containing protein [Planctomycetaceae bacterium]
MLIHAIDAPDESRQSLALAALLRRGDARGFSELIMRYGALTALQQAAVDGAAGRMSGPLMETIDDGPDWARTNAFQIIRNARAFIYVTPLLEHVAEEGEAARESLTVVRELVAWMHETPATRSGQPYRGNKPGLHNRTRKEIVRALADTLPLVGEPSARRELAEALLIAGDPADEPIQRLLRDRDGDDSPGTIVWEVVASGTHPGVLQFVVAALSADETAENIADILQRQADRDFVLRVLEALPIPLGETLSANLRRITSFGWLDPARPDFEWVPRELQGRFVSLLAASGLPSEDKLNVIQWVVRHGSVMGRIAALELLTEQQPAEVEDAICNGLSSEDVEVRAWATSQLREHSIPQAFTLLLEGLESPSEEVQATARKELAGFDLPLMLTLADKLPPQTCLCAGRLIRKIDPETSARLEEELQSPLRRRRLHVIRAARAMNLHRHVESALVELLRDEDHAVVRAAIEALGDLSSEATREELQRLTRTDNPRIRAAAESALQRRASVES